MAPKACANLRGTMQAERAVPLPTAATATQRDNNALVARQPVYGANLTVAAYELMYASAPGQDEALSASEATLQVLADAALEIGLDRLAGGLPVHIHYPAALLRAENPLSVQPQRVVIQVAAGDSFNAAARAGLCKLKARGHLIALDQYSPKFRDAELLELVNLVKMPLDSLPAPALEQLVPLLSKRGLGVVARDVRTVEQFDLASRMGFDGFQGEFLSKPQKLVASRPPRNGLATLKLVASLQSPACTFEEVEQIMRRDLAMSYRALRCVNSSYYNLPQKVDSIHQALVLLGMDNLRQLCSLAALQQVQGRPRSILVMAMTRARMCEQLATLSGEAQTAPFFITGLFSMLDVLMGMPITQLIGLLPLAPNVEAALVSGAGSLGRALACARAYESATFDEAVYPGVSPQLIRAAYLDAVHGAEQALAAA